MAHNDMPCPKCSGKMQEGFIYDQAYGASLVSRWVQGPPEKSLLSGVKLKGRKMIETRTFRCDKCGFLESYAK
jgi:DNA-directed RNA polymerase subunit RPC12/RpoP